MSQISTATVEDLAEATAPKRFWNRQRRLGTALVVGDELSDAPADFGSAASLFVYVGQVLSPAARTRCASPSGRSSNQRSFPSMTR